MKKLYGKLGDRVHFVDIHVRQAHPGSSAPPYRSIEQKLREARAYKKKHGIPWPLLVDDLRGTVHQSYGSLPNATYILDREGKVAFYNLWTGVPVLHRAVSELLSQDGTGIVHGGIHLRPHPLATLAAGWPAIARGGRGSMRDLMMAAPGSPLLLWMGYKLKPVLSPLALRATPLPLWMKIAGGAALVAAFTSWWWRRQRT